MNAVEVAFKLRTEELRRRVDALPDEVEGWRRRTTGSDDIDMNLHFSQLAALKVLMEAYFVQQRALLGVLDPSSPPADFCAKTMPLISSIINAQRMWNFFRSKLDLRFSPEFKAVLRITDIVAGDCYRAGLHEAEVSSIISRGQVREPPLTYLVAEFSPATWVRNSRPNDGRAYDLGEARLPIPAIQVPWDHVKNIWELLSLHHEVGHDIEADLKLRPVLTQQLGVDLAAAHVDPGRMDKWRKWQGEVIADLLGLQLGGPAYAEMLLNLLILPSADVMTMDDSDPHPNHYVRVLFNAAAIRAMAGPTPDAAFVQQLTDHANAIEGLWRGIYGGQPALEAYVTDFPIVIRALLDTPYPALGGRTMRALVPFTPQDDLRIRTVAGFLATGQNPPAGKVAPRYAVSAARLAVSQLLQSGAPASSFDDVDARTAKLIERNRPESVFATVPAERAEVLRQFVRSSTLATLGTLEG